MEDQEEVFHVILGGLPVTKGVSPYFLYSLSNTGKLPTPELRLSLVQKFSAFIHT